MDELAHAGLGPRPFARWADPEDTAVPSSKVPVWLVRRLGGLTPSPAVPVSDIPVPPSALPPAAADALRSAVGTAHVDLDAPARLAHAGGQSYLDLVRRRAGHEVAVPDAVVSPGSHDEVAAVLAVAGEHGFAVVPYGGGTSVVGGVEPVGGVGGSVPGGPPRRAVVTLDLARMDALVAVDEVSRTATFQPGVTGPRAEALLAPYGLTLGHVPQSFARATLGGYVATRSAGQASTGYGRLDELVVALRLATPVGEVRAGTGTPNAAGPDLRAVFVGSEGAFGVVTEVTLRVRPRPVEHRYEMWVFPSFEQGLAAVRAFAQDCSRPPDVVRLSDEEETRTTLATQGAAGRALAVYVRTRAGRTPAVCVLGWEGAAGTTSEARSAVLPVLRAHDAIRVGARAGQAWRRHRFAGPHQRDVLLDAGALVETVETATDWADLTGLYAAVSTALATSVAGCGTPPLVFAHVSHIYPTGASLYFTVLARRLADPAAAVAQWADAKAAASEAIRSAGGTITHHHAVGRTHAPYLEGEIGPVGARVLAAVKAALDPAGILNPGVLVQPPGEPPSGRDGVRPEE
ncbi:FAD-binding oxidoreductase [Actinopolymorpha rutila]|uniref:Alkyldihydroxyacetonephosphate synthase n=1 Tax=Actinopolymorpha rutila TaxID=446787 RepID=A0A852Z4Q4_9ACTN|nr:FAD-binding oxidoreductase [Actinopolymorpha rutila]NYH87934.1 alkyldihydroxyacetonephosphate synthase [Actinopolymorpha rutila]